MRCSSSGPQHVHVHKTRVYMPEIALSAKLGLRDESRTHSAVLQPSLRTCTSSKKSNSPPTCGNMPLVMSLLDVEELREIHSKLPRPTLLLCGRKRSQVVLYKAIMNNHRPAPEL